MANEITKVTDQNGVDHPFKDVAAFPRSEQAVLGAKNLNPYPVGSRGLIDAQGDFTAGAGNYTSDYIACSENIIVSYSARIGSAYHRIACYDANKQFISRPVDSEGKNNCLYELPIGTAFIRLSMEDNVGAGFTDFMIRLATDSDDTFVPYAMTNRELSKIEEGAITGTISGATIESGSVFKSIGKVCWVYVKIKLSSALATGNRINISGTNLPKPSMGDSYYFSPVFGVMGDIAWLDKYGSIVYKHDEASTLGVDSIVQFNFCYPIA